MLAEESACFWKVRNIQIIPYEHLAEKSALESWKCSCNYVCSFEEKKEFSWNQIIRVIYSMKTNETLFFREINQFLQYSWKKKIFL